MTLLRFLPSVLIIMASTTLISCGNKLVEGSPDSVPETGATLEERLASKARIDDRIAEIEGGAKKIQRLLILLQEVRMPEKGVDVYTPIDFVIDVSNELERKIPDLDEDGNYVQSLNFELPDSSKTEKCAALEVKMLFRLIYSEDGSKIVGEKLSLLVRGCTEDLEFVEVLTAEWDGKDIFFEVHNDAINKYLSDVLTHNIESRSTCMVGSDKDGIIDEIRCENLSFNVSASEFALVKKFHYSLSSDIRLSAEGSLAENEIEKAVFSFSLSADGQISSKFESLEDEDQAATSEVESEATEEVEDANENSLKVTP